MIFGGLRVGADRAMHPIVGDIQQRFLVTLATELGRRVSYRALADDLWPGEAPVDARAALQSAVSRLRRQLSPNVIETVEGGYRLTLAPEDVDFVQFRALVAAAEGTLAAGDSAAATAHARAALALWVDDPWLPDGYEWLGTELEATRHRATQLAGTSEDIDAAAPHAPKTARPSGATPASTGKEATPRHRIAAPLLPLVGRDGELRLIAEQLNASRLVTIIGPGGAGKTTRATSAAHKAQAETHHETVLVELAPVGPAGVRQSLISAVIHGIRQPDTVSTRPPSGAVPDATARLLAQLWGRPVLIVLDNCEHVIEETAALANELLHELPELRILATSREPLGIVGEAFVTLGPLSDTAALDIFSARVQAARGTPIQPTESDTARTILSHLDGLPLAIELAAARTRSLSLTEVSDGLSDRFRLLAGGPRASSPRHQTLRALIDWSWDLLSPDERTALTLAAIPPSGLSTATVMALVASHDVTDVFDTLVDKSMLHWAAGRYRALETVREYVLHRVGDAEADLLHTALADVFTAQSSVQDAALRTADIVLGLPWFTAEQENIDYFIRYCFEHAKPVRAARLCAAWSWYLQIRANAGYQAGTLGMLIHGFDRTIIADAGAVSPKRTYGAGDRMAIAVTATVWFAGLLTESTPADRPAIVDRDLPALLHLAERIEPDVTTGETPPGLAGLVHPLLDTIATAPTDQMGEGTAFLAALQLPTGEAYGRDPWTCALLHLARASIAWNAGDFDLFRREVLATDPASDRWIALMTARSRVITLILDGRLDEALALAETPPALPPSVLSGIDTNGWESLVIDVLVRLDRTDEAMTRILAVLDTLDDADDPYAVGIAHWIAATTAWAARDKRAMHEHLNATETFFDSTAITLLQGQASIGMLRALAAQAEGELAVAAAAARAAIDVAIESRDLPVMADATTVAGLVEASRGNLALAAEALAVSTFVRGTADPTAPVERRLREALDAATGNVPGTSTMPTQTTITARVDRLRQLLSRLVLDRLTP